MKRACARCGIDSKDGLCGTCSSLLEVDTEQRLVWIAMVAANQDAMHVKRRDCSICGEEIEKARLKADPGTDVCAECWTRRDPSFLTITTIRMTD